ncbi:CRTAM protein, partial [Heliornis fulica]|nr:CRTAM protein [Heliornis fulica]
LKDQRYKLLHYSEHELSIQLSNVTVRDEGLYRCSYYSHPLKSKNTTLEVLAAPSNPVLEASQDGESSVTLSCSTQGCKPQPQITWLLGNGIEIAGDTKHKLEADGKKWTTTSTLKVLAYGPNSTASCIVHHQVLSEKKLMASVQFEDLPKTGTETASNGNTTENELPSAETSVPSENVSMTSLITFKQDLKSDTIKKKTNNLLLPILVASLILVLLIIVLLFMRKLKKAHGVWKRENDVSEQTLESYKSKSNEDSPGHEKNKQ